MEPGRALATPAVGQRRVFVGGFGSYDFYALAAESGRVSWHLRTKDDGPTAAVLEDGLAIFNTESCRLEVVEMKSGCVVWAKWVGDPVLAQPTVMDGRVFTALSRDGHHWLGAFSGTRHFGKRAWATI